MYTKDTLARLGKEASDLFVKHNMSLNDAVIKVASAHKDMSKEHVQRVIENANLVTFEELFRDGPSKHVTFDLADPEVIHSKMAGAGDGGPMGAYLEEPDDDDDSTDDGFDVAQPDTKTASYVPPNVTWRREYYATKQAVAHLVKEASAADAQAEAAVHNFVTLCKRAAYTDGVRPTLQLASYASRDKQVFTKIASAVTAGLPVGARDGDFTDSAPNPDHPIYTAYATAEQLVKAAQLLRSALINAEKMHQRVVSEAAL
jgi:hypothetical protein